MLRHIVGCLSLTLGVVVAPAAAQQVQWQSTSAVVNTPSNSNTGFAYDRAPSTRTDAIPPQPQSTGGTTGTVTLKRPQPYNAAATPGQDRDVTTVQFRPTVQGQTPGPIIQEQTETLPQPMPVGPGGAKKDGNPTTLAMPTPLGQTDVWGGPVSPWPGSSPVISSEGGLEPFGGGTFFDGAPCGDCSLDGCCGLFRRGRPDNRFWLNAEYLLWTVKGAPLPPLVTTSLNPFGDFSPGAIGQPGTVILYGDSHVSQQAFSGARFETGFWFGPCQRWGLDSSFFFLGQRSSDFVAGSNGLPALFRPFFNTNLPVLNVPGNDAEIVAFPRLLAGSVVVQNQTRLSGFDVDLRRNLCRTCNSHLDFLFGYRYLDLSESLQIQENLTALVPVTSNAIGDRVIITDRFATRNQFSGGQLGLDYECNWGRWLLGGFTKVALGNTHESVSINGNTIFAPVGQFPTTASGGLLAQGSNIGHFTDNHFAVVPEVGVKIGYRFSDWCRVYVGYNFLYISDVLRPGDQVDLRLNTAQVPRLGQAPALPIPPPVVPFRHTDFWAQGVNFGVQFTW
jgi:hypothetical protein